MTKQNKKDLCRILLAAALFVLGNVVQAGGFVRFAFFFTLKPWYIYVRYTTARAYVFKMRPDKRARRIRIGNYNNTVFL